MFPATVTFVEGTLPSVIPPRASQRKATNTHESFKVPQSVGAAKPKNNATDTVPIDKDIRRVVTRGRTRKSAAAAEKRVGQEPSPLQKPKEKKPSRAPGGPSPMAPWIEKHKAIPTRMGPYSLSSYSCNSAFPASEGPSRLPHGLRTMALRTFVRCPNSEAGSKYVHTSGTQRKRHLGSHSKWVLPQSSDTSPPPSPPNLTPSYSIRAYPVSWEASEDIHI